MHANSWLTILHEYSDRAAYEDDPIWKEERAPSRIEPSAPIIDGDRAHGNGRRVAGPTYVTSHNCFALQALALSRGRHGDIARYAGRLRNCHLSRVL
jgi:hypothetical protein